MDALEKSAVVVGILVAAFLLYGLVTMILYYDPTEPRAISRSVSEYVHTMHISDC